MRHFKIDGAARGAYDSGRKPRALPRGGKRGCLTMLFFGTGAAELYPNPFCNCEFCEGIRSSGEMPRKRSCMLMDAHNMIDFGPEALAAAQMYGARLYDVDNLFITHSHEDHLCFSNIEVLSMTPQRDHKPLNIYLSESACDFVMRYMEALRPVYARGETTLESLVKSGVVVFHPVKPYTRFAVDGMEVFTVESNHMAHGQNEHALNYLFTRKEGGSLLYAADTGLYSQENLQTLASSAVDVLVMEGTFGDIPVEGARATHLNAANFVRQLENLLEHGVITPKTAVYMTHINQVQHLNHSAYQAYMDEHAPLKVIVAHDGLRA